MESLGVSRVFYQLKGTCRSSLIEACDRNIYVLKIAGSSGPNLLFNEAFGSELLRFFGLPVPKWAALTMSDEFIDAHPEMWSVDGEKAIRPSCGPHFGSRLVVSHGTAGAYQIIPSVWAPRVINAVDFVGALAVDIWTNHCDSRQAVYTHCGSGQHLRATFIDHGHMFGGPHGDKRCRPRASMQPDLRLYRGLEIGTLLRCWHSKIGSVTEDHLKHLLYSGPSQWLTPQVAEHTLAMLESRREDLSVLFEEATQLLTQRQDSFLMPRAISSIAPRVRGWVCPA
jgi:hypothetical protein